MALKKEREVFAQPKSKRKIFGIPMPHRFVVYDKLQRGTVFLLVSVTVIGFFRLFADSVHYYMYRKPVMREKARLLKEIEMTAMQAEKEKELSKTEQLQDRLQKEADKIR